MITRLEIKGYRCLHYLNRPVEPFQVLVGSNASGKTTFSDAIVLLGDILRHGLQNALAARSPNFMDLTWQRSGEPFEVVVEAAIPESRKGVPGIQRVDRCRYEVKSGPPPDSEDRHSQWVRHIRTALPDIEDVTTVVREDDKHCYLVIQYRVGMSVPSWTASDGTLRLLALTQSKPSFNPFPPCMTRKCSWQPIPR